MKNFYKLIKQNKLNVSFTKDEITALQEFLDDKIETQKINPDLQDALLKIGMVLPVSNRGGKGKDIEKLLLRQN
jgi:hypothetical protein